MAFITAGADVIGNVEFKGAGKAGGTVWETLQDGQKLGADELLDKATSFLGKHRPVGPNRFLSEDGLRQVRMDLSHKSPHFNFELIPEKATVGNKRVPDKKHIYLDDK